MIEQFKLSNDFSNEYMVTRAKDALVKLEYNSVVKIILARQLFSEFDILDLCMKLGEKGAHNRKLVIQLLTVVPKFTDQVIERFSTDAEYDFAFDIVQAFKLQLNRYSALQTIKASRHPIVDMAFTDPKTDSKHVPLHVMEDLISGDQRLLQKMFFALIRKDQPQRAAGLYLRNMFPQWAPAHVKDTFSKLPKYDQAQDLKHKDEFAPFKQGEDIMKLPTSVKLHWIEKVSDVQKL